MNALPKVVLSRTLREATWSNTRIIRDPDQIAALKREPGKPIVASSGARLVATLARLGLVDGYRLVVSPVVLGAGTPLFQGVAMKLRQARTQTLGSGMTVLCYEPQRDAARPGSVRASAPEVDWGAWGSGRQHLRLVGVSIRPSAVRIGGERRST